MRPGLVSSGGPIQAADVLVEKSVTNV